VALSGGKFDIEPKPGILASQFCSYIPKEIKITVTDSTKGHDPGIEKARWASAADLRAFLFRRNRTREKECVTRANRFGAIEGKTVQVV